MSYRDIVLCFPFPPSKNTYWGRFTYETFLSDAGRKYVAEIDSMFHEESRNRTYVSDSIDLGIIFNFPDNRNRRIDELTSVILDVLVRVDIIKDTKNISSIVVKKKIMKKVNYRDVTIWKHRNNKDYGSVILKISSSRDSIKDEALI